MTYHTVALLAEGVDRNHVTLSGQNGPTLVALLAEGVDRNQQSPDTRRMVRSRPPRGGRG